ncbi:DUF3596 domain-containing protein [Leptothermofonsia sichuanensis E412]|uniref:Arm DNA-binding domain-containing protein n=1 Tax=Leptothermofonsia sichuanensis TaxID=2917832 RepID=UPI001CA7A180|nr:DUF3596 domain-containing protein [Leptothermofonsia sichuanensis]QZZ21133.1 DUF3596 domain-containing protein [Leptothermofonsia sichuanensis E412]
MARVQVNLEAFEGRLRLRWRHGGKRYCLALGLSDRPVNRLVGEQKARVIEADIATGNFDSTLVKYRPAANQDGGILLVELFSKFSLINSSYLKRKPM